MFRRVISPLPLFHIILLFFLKYKLDILCPPLSYSPIEIVYLFPSFIFRILTMGGCPPIWCAFTPGFIVWMMVLIDCTLKLIYFMLISVHSDRFHSPLQFFVSMKTAAFFSIALQFDRPELSNWPIGGLEIQFDKFGKIWCGRMKACDLLGWIHHKASGGRGGYRGGILP